MGRGGEGVASRAKPPMVAGHRAIQPTWMFTWYNSVESVSRRASMRCSCAMTSSSVTLPIAEEGVDVVGAKWDGAEWEGEATEFDCLDRNCASLRFTVAVSMVHMKMKWLDKGKRTEKWHKILMIAKGKISLSRDVESKWISIIDRNEMRREIYSKMLKKR